MADVRDVSEVVLPGSLPWRRRVVGRPEPKITSLCGFGGKSGIGREYEGENDFRQKPRMHRPKVKEMWTGSTVEEFLWKGLLGEASPERGERSIRDRTIEYCLPLTKQTDKYKRGDLTFETIPSQYRRNEW